MCVCVGQGFFSDFFCRGKKIANAAAPAAGFFYPRKINSQHYNALYAR